MLGLAADPARAAQDHREPPAVASPASTECRASWAAPPGTVCRRPARHVAARRPLEAIACASEPNPVLVGTDRLGRLRPLCATGQEHPLPRDTASDLAATTSPQEARPSDQ